MMTEQTNRTWAEVHMGRLEENYRAIRRLMPRGCKYLALVKANAYGHGALPVARKYQELGADYFAVACLEEGEELRRGGIVKPILILGYTHPEYTYRLLQGGITQTIYDEEMAEEFSRQAVVLGKKLTCHLKVDTGMGRLGFRWDKENWEESLEKLTRVAKLPGLNPEGIFMHFSVADSDNPENIAYSREQLRRFKAATEALGERGITFSIRHSAASAALMNYHEAHFEMVRPGIIQYGVHPDESTQNKLDLKPVMALKSRIVSIKNVPKGADISYGRTYTLSRDSRIAVIPAGYADGLFRLLSNRQDMVVRGKRVPQIGRVCMDMCMLDVTDVPEVQVGDEVEIFGDHVTVEEKASAIGTIPYELLCAPSARVPRVYRED